MNADVCGLAGGPAKGLMDQDLRIRLAPALAPCPGGGQKKGPHARRHAAGHGSNIALQRLYGIIDAEAGGDRSARALDIDGDILLRVSGETPERRVHNGRRIIVDLPSERDGAMGKVNIHGSQHHVLPVEINGLLHQIVHTIQPP